MIFCDNFLLQDFFDMYSFMISEMKLLFNSILFVEGITRTRDSVAID